MGRVRELDGVRGLAAAAVVLFHAGWLPFGWVGVQVFFVLSGYLIARDLSARPSGFYARRAARILPLHVVYLCTAAIAATWHGMSLRDFAMPALFLGNVRVAQGPMEAAGLLTHLWSLAAEVQFYAVAPLLVAAVKHDRRIAVALVAIGLVSRGIWVGAGGDFGIGPPLDAFALGIALSAYRVTLPRQSWLACRPLVRLGQISFSLYMWHLLVFAAVGDRGVIGIASAIVVAALSYAVVERPIIRTPRHRSLTAQSV